jgi:hypothetical protein
LFIRCRRDSAGLCGACDLRFELTGGEIAVDHRGQPVARGARPVQSRHHVGAQVAQHAAHGRFEQFVLAAEIMVDDARRYPGGPADDLHRGVGIAVPADRGDGRCDQLLSPYRFHSQFRHRRIRLAVFFD